MQYKDRIIHVDYLKAIAIILVVIGHAITYYIEKYGTNTVVSFIYGIIYSFHIALFFVIAGYFCKSKSVSNQKKDGLSIEFGVFLKSKVFRLLIPFYFFALMKVLFMYFVAPDMSHTGSLIGDIIETLLYGQVYWFCYSLLIMYLIGFFLQKSSKMVILLIILVTIVVNQILEVTDFKVTDILQIRSTLISIVFFEVGLLLRKVITDKTTLYDIIGKRRFFLIPLCIIISCTLVPFYSNIKNFYLPSILLAFAMIVLIYYFSMFVERKVKEIKLLNLIGKYTLQIMFIEGFFRIVLFKFCKSIIETTWVSVLFIAIIDIMLCILCCMMIKKIPILRFVCGIPIEKCKKEPIQNYSDEENNKEIENIK